MNTPFQIFPWDKAFLPALVEVVDGLTGGQPLRALLVVPHNRPRRYLTELYKHKAQAQGTSLLLPQVLTVQELLHLLRGHVQAPAACAATMLDRVALLHGCVQALAAGDSALCAPFAGMDIPHFLPWGLRLSAVFEECFTQNIQAQDMNYAEGEVSALAAVLLKALGHLQGAYMQALRDKEWTTPGLDAFTVVRSLQNLEQGAAADPDRHSGPWPGLPPLLRPADSGAEGEGRVVILAGFAVLSGTEEYIFRYLWRAGAHIFLHTDSALGQNPPHKSCHWACEEHRRWIERWGAETVLALPGPLSAESPHVGPKLHFIAGYDAHSQLAALSSMLGKDGNAAQATMSTASAQITTSAQTTTSTTSGPSAQTTTSTTSGPSAQITTSTTSGPSAQTTTSTTSGPSTAIVLGDSGLLLPVLHSLPDKGVNISMGYPLERTPLCRLLEALLQAQSHRHEDGRYHWRSLRHVLRHPYLQMLTVQGGERSQSLRPVLQNMENALREGSRFVDVPSLLASVLAALDASPSPVAALAKRVCACLLDNFAAAHSPEALARAVAELCALLVECGEHLWERYPLDAESMYRLMHDVVPGLRASALAQTLFPQSTLHSLLRQAVQAGRVPFEADPIAGMQVMGMLETRLLHFDRVVILDATDDNLPGSPAQDPLLPDSLRCILGLPDARHRDRTAAHTLYRLMNGATDVYFYWQEGVQRSALFEGKKSRSRFVDACIWQEEQRRGLLLKAGEEPLQVTPCPVRPMPRTRRPLRKTPALRARMAALMAEGLSPTRLDSYITCPLRFALEHVCGIKALQELNEGDDPAVVGVLIHRVLQQSYTPFVGKDLPEGALTAEMLTKNFHTCLQELDLRHQLPPDSYCMLELAGPLRLSRYLERQPAQSRILALEQRFESLLDCNEASYRLYGTLDRLDLREGQLVVLDYKTGDVPCPKPDLWADTGYWQSLECYFAGLEGASAKLEQGILDKVAPDPILELKAHIHSVQLPFYVHLAGHADSCRRLGPVGDAAWVCLREDGREIPLFGDKCDPDLRQQALEKHIPTLLRFILQHMELAEEFIPVEGPHCQWCAQSGLCLQ